MTVDAVVELMRGESPIHAVPLGSRPLAVGRGTANDLVIPDETVSWHHALVWEEGGWVWIRDLGARNGTFHNGTRVAGATRLADGDLLRLGPDVVLRLRIRGEQSATVGQLILEDLESGLRFPLRRDRFVIGSGKDADLFVEGAAGRLATVLVHAGGEVWLGLDQGLDGEVDDRALELDVAFEVAGRRLCLREESGTHAPTVEAERARYPYKAIATLNGPTGPEARVVDLASGTSCMVEAGNRAVLLYLLARQVQQDRAEGKPQDQIGWCSDHDVAVGIWGAVQSSMDGNSLHVLIYRVRRELSDAGFDPWFIEKKRRFLRARLSQVELD
jgi:FHA domain